ncbi:hypothetical protein [Paraburkholderia sp. MM6662-R1]|uniref:hypothetical protein n=1 Tax=Paraburkholderia sp. MM6662-R1 TaxID=2991066 RepID=UPI003D1DC60D
MQFNPDAFNRFLGGSGNIGQQYQWYSSDACPCADRHSGMGKPGCPLCFGRGRQFAAPVTGVAALSGQSSQREWAQFGVYEQGDVVMTIPENTPIYEIGQYDRMTALNATNHFSQVLVSGSGAERLYFATQAITRVFWLTLDGTAVVEGGIPVVAADGSLSWPAGGQPPPGAQYTISGTKFMDYFCFGNFPSNRNMQQGLRLPRKVVLRDFDLFNR